VRRIDLSDERREHKRAAKRARPANIKRFELLMYLAAAISVAAAPFITPDVPASYYVVLALWGAFLFFLIWMVAHRRANWARWLLFALFCLETLYGFYFAPAPPPATAVVRGVITALEAFAYYFVFTGNSRRWFKPDPGMMDDSEMSVFD
jgi:hypothetical protein